MAEVTNKKGKIACVIMTLAFSVFCLIGGRWQTGIYSDLKNNCTSEVTGIVVEKNRISVDDISSDPVATEYLSTGQMVRGRKSIWYSDSGKKWMMHIEVQTDDLFKTENIYADLGTEKEGDTVIIHYSPDDPDKYYFGDRADRFKGSGVFSYAMGGVMFVFSLFLVIFIFKK